MPYDYNFPFQAWDDVNLYSIQLCQMKLHQIWMCNFSLQGHSFKVKGFNLNTFFCVQLTYDILESVHSRSKARSLVLDAWKNCMIHHKNQILNQVGVVVRNSQSCWPENEFEIKLQSFLIEALVEWKSKPGVGYNLSHQNTKIHHSMLLHSRTE